MSKMSNFRSQWAKAEVKFASEFDVPEDGKYRVVIEDVKYSEVDFNNNPTDPTFIYIFRVIDGNCTGMRFRKFSTIRSEMNLSYLKGDLTRLGLPVPADPEELIAVFPSARGLTLEVTVKSRTIDGKVYKDCNIDRLYKADPSKNNPDYNPFVENRQAQPMRHQGYPQSFCGGYPEEVPF